MHIKFDYVLVVESLLVDHQLELALDNFRAIVSFIKLSLLMNSIVRRFFSAFCKVSLTAEKTMLTKLTNLDSMLKRQVSDRSFPLTTNLALKVEEALISRAQG